MTPGLWLKLAAIAGFSLAAVLVWRGYGSPELQLLWFTSTLLCH